MKKTGARLIIAGVLFGILSFIFACSAGLAFIHADRNFYPAEVDRLGISQACGYSQRVCVENYNAVMKYLSPFENIPFDIPDFKYSQGAAQHFADCKNLFLGIYISGLTSLILMCIMFFKLKRKIGRGFLPVSALTTTGIIALIAAVVIIDFDTAFDTFHRIFFRNYLWLFDYSEDPVLYLFPPEFFFDCGMIIAGFCIAISAAVTVLYFLCRKRHKTNSY